MNTSKQIPSFDARIPFLDHFVLKLVENYRSGKINSWAELDKIVKGFFTSERMKDMEAILPGWHKMASYDDGITLVHVMCAFLGLYRMPEFLSLHQTQQQIMKWVIVLHDIEKEPRQGKRDHAHAFRSAVTAARILPGLGFAVSSEYDSLIRNWSEFTRAAVTFPENEFHEIQDNRKLPEILEGIEKMFGLRSSGTFVIKTILFHLSVDLQLWPPAAPLTDAQVNEYFDAELVPLLRVMNLADGEGWGLFHESRDALRNDTLESFKRIEQFVLS